MMIHQYNAEEKVFLSKVEDWIERVERQHHVYWTPFLTPREVQLVQHVVYNFPSIQSMTCGVFGNAERQKMCLAPDYVVLNEEVLPMTLLNIVFATKFHELKHSQILGSLLATGIERNRIGDIVTNNTEWQVCVSDSIADFLIQEISSIGRTPVKLQQIPLDKAIPKTPEGEQKEIIVSSMRMDVVVAKVFNISRQIAKDLIVSGKVSHNYAECTRVDQKIECGNHLSVRRYGKCWIESLEGHTKKGNTLLKIRVIYK